MTVQFNIEKITSIFLNTPIWTKEKLVIQKLNEYVSVSVSTNTTTVQNLY